MSLAFKVKQALRSLDLWSLVVLVPFEAIVYCYNVRLQWKRSLSLSRLENELSRKTLTKYDLIIHALYILVEIPLFAVCVNALCCHFLPLGLDPE